MQKSCYFQADGVFQIGPLASFYLQYLLKGIILKFPLGEECCSNLNHPIEIPAIVYLQLKFLFKMPGQEK